MEKNGEGKKHRKTQGVLATWGSPSGRRQGVQPLSPSERRERLRQGHGQLRAAAGPWPDLSAYARQSANYVGPFCGSLAGNVGPSCGYVGLCCPHVDRLSKKARQSWGYVGPSWGYVGPSWSYVGPSWGYVAPSWNLCWPILRLCWPTLRPMLAHVDPARATRSEKWEKMGRAQERRGRQGWRPLSPTERGAAVRQCHGQGAPVPPAADPRGCGLGGGERGVRVAVE